MPNDTQTIVQLNGPGYDVEVSREADGIRINFTNIDVLSEQDWNKMNERITSAIGAMHSIRD